MKNLFGKKAFLITLISCVGVFLVLMIIWTFSFYPVAFVNYKPIMAYDYQKSLDVATKFLNANKPQDINSVKEIVFDSLIDQVGIDAFLKKASSTDEIQKEINTQVNSILEDSQIKQSLEAKSISQNDAAKYLLAPEVKNQLLSNELLSQGKSMLEWIMDNRKASSVFILMPRAHWSGSEVKFD
jgi:hypothetical protein